LGEAQKKASSLASRTARLLQRVPEEVALKHMQALEQLHAAVAADVPAFRKHTAQSKKQWRRQDHHRKNRPLFPGRGGVRSLLAPGLAVMKKVCKKFGKQREVGRPKTKRGILSPQGQRRWWAEDTMQEPSPALPLTCSGSQAAAAAAAAGVTACQQAP
jgi:hypothetical protein